MSCQQSRAMHVEAPAEILPVSWHMTPPSTDTLRGAVKKFPEMWYTTVMVGHITNHLQSRTLACTHTHTHTLAPSILPLLEAPVEGFLCNLLEFGHRIRFDVSHVCKKRPLEAHFQSREEPKVTRSEIWRVWWLGDDRNACAMQFGGNGTSGRESGFCITVTHQATHRLLCSISSLRKAFLSSPNHCTVQISLWVTFGWLR